MLIARIHKTRSNTTHLRVGQSFFREELRLKLQRIGSPARWIPSHQEWDTPLVPGAVVRLAEIAREIGEQVEWRDGLQAYAEQHLKQSDYEHEVRLAIERIMRDGSPLEPYPTLMKKMDGIDVPPTRYQQVAWHWSQRTRGILLAWEMGCVGAGSPVLVKRIEAPSAKPAVRWISIENVQLDDLVWDGDAWVAHEGVLDQGEKFLQPVGYAPDVFLTYDHKILINGATDEWREFGEAGELTICRATATGRASLDRAGKSVGRPIDSARQTRGWYSEALSMERPRRAYDLLNCGPRHRFQCGDFILANCGKTRAAADAAGGWYRNSQIPPMTSAVFDGKPAVSGGVLVVCPRTMMKTWQEELALWQNAASVVVHGSSAQRKLRLAGQPSHFHIVNYEGLKYVLHNHYAGVILDEIHKCSNSSGFTNNSVTIAERATKKLGLTGTPISNDLKGIFYPMLILDGGRALGPSRTAFLEKYFNKTINFAAGNIPDYEAKQDAHIEIAKAIATSSYFLKKTEALPFLPKKTHTPIYLPMTEEQKRYYEQLRRETLVYIQDATVSVEQASARMMKLLQICQGFALTDDDKGGRHFTDVKTETLMDLLTDQLREQKVIVWAYFTYEIERLSQALTSKGISHLRIDGTVTGQKVRDAAKDRWNTDSSVKVFIRQLSMSEGVTLLGTKDSPCSTAIYLTLNYRMTDLLQSQDRNHRIGQEHPCTYLYLLTENGVDRKVYGRLLEKVETAEAVQKQGKRYYTDLLEAMEAA